MSNHHSRPRVTGPPARPPSPTGRGKASLSYLLNPPSSSDVPSRESALSGTTDHFAPHAYGTGKRSHTWKPHPADSASQFVTSQAQPVSHHPYHHHPHHHPQHHGGPSQHVPLPPLLPSLPPPPPPVLPVPHMNHSLPGLQNQQPFSLDSNVNASAPGLSESRTSMSAGAGPSNASDKKHRARNYVCDTCGFPFYTNSDLQKHVSSVHEKLRPYGCEGCDKKFGEKSNATKHFKSVHQGQRTAACDQCNKVFAFRDGLSRHVRLVHQNVRNFHCDFPGCTQTPFKQHAHLRKHRASIHKLTDEGSAGGGSSRSHNRHVGDGGTTGNVPRPSVDGGSHGGRP